MKSPATLLDSIKMVKTSVEEARHKQEKSDGYLRNIRGGNSRAEKLWRPK